MAQNEIVTVKEVGWDSDSEMSGVGGASDSEMSGVCGASDSEMSGTSKLTLSTCHNPPGGIRMDHPLFSRTSS